MNELKQKIHAMRLARKQADLGEDIMNGIKAPLSRMHNSEYNPYGALLVGGGTGLLTYLISRLLGIKKKQSLLTSLLTGLGGAHYALGKQHAGGGKYNPLSFDYIKDIIERQRASQRTKVEPATSEQLPVNAGSVDEEGKEIAQPDSMAQAQMEMQDSVRQSQAAMQNQLEEQRANATPENDYLKDTVGTGAASGNQTAPENPAEAAYNSIMGQRRMASVNAVNAVNAEAERRARYSPTVDTPDPSHQADRMQLDLAALGVTPAIDKVTGGVNNWINGVRQNARKKYQHDRAWERMHKANPDLARQMEIGRAQKTLLDMQREYDTLKGREDSYNNAKRQIQSLQTSGGIAQRVGDAAGAVVNAGQRFGQGVRNAVNEAGKLPGKAIDATAQTMVDLSNGYNNARSYVNKGIDDYNQRHAELQKQQQQEAYNEHLNSLNRSIQEQAKMLEELKKNSHRR